MNRKAIFDAIRSLFGRGFTHAEVATIDDAVDQAMATPDVIVEAQDRVLGEAGLKLIKTWEGCAKRQTDGTFVAYPDPGSADGRPWTIGWGSTGPDIKPGLVWTQAQCDARFAADIVTYVKAVAEFLGQATTSANQFDALVSFHYNTGAIRTSTLGRLHKQGRFDAARAEFARWIYNDGKVMNGLKARRAQEAKLYATPL